MRSLISTTGTPESSRERLRTGVGSDGHSLDYSVKSQSVTWFAQTAIDACTLGVRKQQVRLLQFASR